MTSCLLAKDGNVWHSVSHLAADGIKALEGGALYDMLLTILDDAMELIQTLGGLGIEIDITVEIQLTYFLQMLHILQLLYHEGMTLGLSLPDPAPRHVPSFRR